MFHETPQFITQEVKLMGLITFNQLWIILGIAVFLVVLFMMLPLGLWIILFVLFAPAGLFLSLGQINGQSVYKVIPSVIRHFWLPKYYFWQKEKNMPILTGPTQKQKQTKIVAKQHIEKVLDNQTLENLSQFFDQ